MPVALCVLPVVVQLQFGMRTCLVVPVVPRGGVWYWLVGVLVRVGVAIVFVLVGEWLCGFAWYVVLVVPCVVLRFGPSVRRR